MAELVVTKTKKRIEYMDIAKGIGILLMIIGHIKLEHEKITTFIYSFHMPLFFLISGYFFKHRIKKDEIKYILRHLIIPYIITCLSIILYNCIRLAIDQNYNEIINVIKEIGKSSLFGCGYGMHYGIRQIGAIWFLLALSVALYLMNSIYTSRYRVILVVIIAYIGYVTSKYVWLPLSIQPGMVALIYIYLGMLAHQHDLLNQKIPAYMYIYMVGLVIFSTLFLKKMCIVTNTYNGVIDFLVGISGTVLCIKISQLIESRTRFVKKGLIFIGQNSLKCMCIHLFSLNCLRWRTAHRLLERIGIYNTSIRNILIQIIWVIILVAVIQIIKDEIYKFRHKERIF